jgi:hypothetical protein
MGAFSRLLFSCSAALVLLAACGGGLPNAGEIAEACGKLQADDASSVSTAPWPPCIARLEPSRVKVEGGRVWIFLSQQTGQPAHGYLCLHPGQALPADRMLKFKPTSAPTLYSFTQIP